MYKILQFIAGLDLFQLSKQKCFQKDVVLSPD